MQRDLEYQRHKDQLNQSCHRQAQLKIARAKLKSDFSKTSSFQSLKPSETSKYKPVFIKSLPQSAKKRYPCQDENEEKPNQNKDLPSAKISIQNQLPDQAGVLMNSMDESSKVYLRVSKGMRLMDIIQ